MTLSKGYPGMIATHSINKLDIEGRSGSDGVKPGYGVYYDANVSGRADWKLPTTLAESLDVHGVVWHPQSPRESMINRYGEIEINNGAGLRVIIEGIAWVVAGGQINFGDLLRFSHATSGPTSNRWIPYSIPDATAPTVTQLPDLAEAVNTAVNALRDALPKRSIFAMTEATNPGELIQARLTGVVLR